MTDLTYGSLDIRMVLPVFQSGEYVALATDIRSAAYSEDTSLEVRVYENEVAIISMPSGDIIDRLIMDSSLPNIGSMFSETFLPLFISNPSYVPDSYNYLVAEDAVRILFQNSTISIHINGDHHHTFYLPDIEYPEELPTVGFLASSGWTQFPTLEILASELDDWREAIYVETDSVAASGISSLIQDRPISMVTNQDSIDFFYVRSPDEQLSLPSRNIAVYNIVYSDVDSASDVLIQGRDTEALFYEDVADRFGYIFKILQLGSLDSGEKRAARKILKEDLEMSEIHTIQGRPDVRIQPMDILNINFVVSGTSTPIVAAVRVMRSTTRFDYATASMLLECRVAL